MEFGFRAAIGRGDGLVFAFAMDADESVGLGIFLGAAGGALFEGCFQGDIDDAGYAFGSDGEDPDACAEIGRVHQKKIAGFRDDVGRAIDADGIAVFGGEGNDGGEGADRDAVSNAGVTDGLGAGRDGIGWPDAVRDGIGLTDGDREFRVHVLLHDAGVGGGGFDLLVFVNHPSAHHQDREDRGEDHGADASGDQHLDDGEAADRAGRA